ncbi:MAG: GAF domain-containing protein [Deltaproteobacteria bacterium]|jgi:PAS domain S-box-containing protein|nr:GAF domain-containing protein [Deltaproteobacteria bacterium]
MAAEPSHKDLEKRLASLEKELAQPKDSERLLGEKHNQLLKVLDSLDATVYVADLQTYEILYANRYAKKLFGKITGKICWQVLQADMTGPCPFCKKSELIGADGQPKKTLLWEGRNTLNGNWYSIRDRAIDWFDGRIVHLQIAVDISDRKRTEAALQASEEKFRTVADFTYDWEYWINEEGGFNYISPSCERITGYRVEEFEENHSLLYDIIHPNDRQHFKEHLEDELQATEVCHLNFRIRSKDGEEKWISHYCQPVYGKDKKILGRRASNRDITLEKKAQENIRIDQMRQAALLELYDMQTLPVNEMYDFVLESFMPLTGSKIGFLGFLNEDESQLTVYAWSKGVMEQCRVHDKPLVFNIAGSGVWGEAVRKRQPVIINDYESCDLKKGAPEGHVEIKRFMAVPLFDGEKIVAVAAVGNKKNAYDEQDIRQLQLLIKGMWQITKRRRTEERLVKQAEMIKHFTNKVSHDLKNPAIVIYGLARIIERKYKRLEQEKLYDLIKQIVNSSAQIVSLSDDINAYISTRETPLHFKAIDLREVWRLIKEEFSTRLKKRDLIWIEPPSGIPGIKADRNALLRVYRNLVDNALKYGGSNLTEIEMGYNATETDHILSVRNNGKVIPPAEVETIFEVFKRNAGDSSIGGTGLGLSIVREIARQHKGDSWVESNVDGKTTFYISIARNL